MGAWMDGWEREGVEQEADGKGRQETGAGKEGGQEEKKQKSRQFFHVRETPLCSK